MANMNKTLASTGISDRTDTVLVPVHVLEDRRRLRGESIKRTNATIVGSAVADAQREAAQ